MFKTIDSKNVAGVMLIALTIFVLGISEQCFAAPTAYNGVLTVIAGPRTGQLLAAGSGTLTYAIKDEDKPRFGTITSLDTATGTYTYEPNIDLFLGTDLFTFTVTDSTGSVSASINITMNRPPTASNGTLITTKGEINQGQMIASDGNNDDILTFSIVKQASHGTAVITNSSIGYYSYTPDTDYVGADSFIFKAGDGKADSNYAEIKITVNAANSAPIAYSDIFFMRKDPYNPSKECTGNLKASDPEGKPLTYSLVEPSGGMMASPISTPSSSNKFSYIPRDGFTGTDRFIFKVNDGILDSQPAAVTIKVIPKDQNTAPVAQPANYTVTAGSQLNGRLNATDAEGDIFTYNTEQPKDSSSKTHGYFYTNTNSDGSMSFSLDLLDEPTYTGALTFTYNVIETVPQDVTPKISTSATVTIYVVNNSLPVAQTVSKIIPKGTPLSDKVMATDADGDNLIYFKVGDPAHGTLVFNPDGTYSYTPTTNYNGTDQFTFKAHDGVAYSNTATVTIIVGGLPGDVNGDTNINLADAMLVLRILAGITPTDMISLGADVNGDGKIGLEELAYILQKAAGLR